MTRPGRPTLTTPDAWAAAALDELEQTGVRALSVQAVARRLGVSKGGAYHQFSGRRALLQAALARWERRQVTELGERFGAIADPAERLHRLLLYAALEMQPTVILQFMAAADDPDVAAALERSATARLALLRRIFTQLGATRTVAGHRAIIAYSHYLGLAQLRTQSPAVLASPAALRGHVRELERSLLAGLAGA
ncbi:TetR/AcrR family transcriptional regulator [Paraconexibacter antarcticus]|uniref:TetR/AcrR family transcriptional regulator n=1 Tax=Paraconexibacter antarcticus TaxID=2949664 RepID=A0ABY5DQX4_9ACTN|nr:TetR/AcrR family transcriptional regulator [Paraconexibacter antarcticus]UTI64430.1 TetR/AcrR family transcriptional regulator [Paraconexibacter antarcticus]